MNASAEAPLRIVSFGRQGDGVAEGPNGPVFVPFTLPGELVKVAPPFEKPGPSEIIEASPERREPPCLHFGICGGCDLQHASEDVYRSYKRGLVEDALARAGVEAPPVEFVPCPPGSRRRVVLSARRDGQAVVLGYNEAGSHRIVPIVECPIALPQIVGRLPALRRLAEILAPRRDALRLIVTATASGIDVAAEGVGKFEERRRQSAVKSALEANLARLSVDGEVIVLARPPSLACGSATVEIPPGGFVQAVAEIEASMAEIATRHLSGSRKVIDLYSGFGAFSLRLAEQSAVHAVERDGAALSALDAAWRGRPGLKPVTTERRDLDRRPVPAKELKGFDGLVFDPPRAGAEGVAKEIAGSKVRRVVAVSCNPVTFARDVAILIEGGYRMKRVVALDQFLWSHHVETVACLER